MSHYTQRFDKWKELHVEREENNKKKCNNAQEEQPGALWYFWVMLRLRVELWSGIWRWMKTPGGQSMCESYDLGFRPSHRQTKADWKQRLAVYYFCWGMSVRNSPLICFILFYEAVTPNSAVCERRVSSVVSQSPPCGSPVPVLTVSELLWRHMCTSLTQHVCTVEYL